MQNKGKLMLLMQQLKMDLRQRKAGNINTSLILHEMREIVRANTNEDAT